MTFSIILLSFSILFLFILLIDDSLIIKRILINGESSDIYFKSKIFLQAIVVIEVLAGIYILFQENDFLNKTMIFVYLVTSLILLKIVFNKSNRSYFLSSWVTDKNVTITSIARTKIIKTIRQAALNLLIIGILIGITLGVYLFK